MLRVFIDLENASLCMIRPVDRDDHLRGTSLVDSVWRYPKKRLGPFLGLKKWHSQPGWCSFMRHDVVHPGTSYFSNTSEQLYFKPDSEATLVARSTCFIGFQDCLSIESHQSLMLGVLPQQKPQNGTTKICLNHPQLQQEFLGCVFITRTLSGCCAASSNACRAAFAGAKEHDFGPDTSGTVMLSLGCKWMAEDTDGQDMYRLRYVKVY